VVDVATDGPSDVADVSRQRQDSGGPDGPRRDLLAEETATANAVYGVVVSSAVMASSHGQPVLRLAVAVLVTLVIYWAAERFARIMGARIVHSPDLTVRQLRRELSSGWELVSASFLPLGVLLGSSLLGADVDTSVLLALLCATALLFAAGWRVGREASLRPSFRLVSALCSGALGVAMILLKALLH
jgi:hypothetical protein